MATEDLATGPDARSATEAQHVRIVERWDQRARPWIVLAALVPIIGSVAAEHSEGILLAVDFACWFVFVADLYVHVRYTNRYLRHGIGIFDLSIVIITFPWYVIPGLESVDIVLLARLARVARLFIAGAHLGPFRRLYERLGRAALYASVLLVVCAIVLQQVERNNPGFDDLGSSLWFSMVTLATVGYGDVVPQTSAGRLVAVVLMLGGLALLGALAGSLGAFLRIQDTGGGSGGGDVESPPRDADDSTAVELAALRAEIADLGRRMTELQAHLGAAEATSPTARDD